MSLRTAVVVPTHRRSALLAATLDSIERLHCAPDEVIVVIDAADPATERVVAGREVTVLRTSHAGPATELGPAGARNLGWRAAAADVIAFVDDDCVVDPSWLGELLDGFGTDQVGLVQGSTVPTGPVTPTDRTIHVTAETGLYESCNIAYRRAALEAVGGFDEAFAARVRRGGRWFAEDTDLAWRVKRAGWESRFASAAVVRHHVFSRTVRATVAEEWRRGLFPGLVRAIPELRDRTPSRWRLREQSAPAQAALAGIVAAAALRRPLPLLLAAPYVRWAVARGHSPKRLALRAVLDLTGSAALVVGSCRARSVLL